MANDRLYIKCKVCAERIMIGKWWGDYIDMWNMDKIDRYLSEHLLLHGGVEGNALTKGKDLPIVFETEQDE